MPEQDLLSIDVQGEFRQMSQANCQDGGALPHLNRDCQQLDSSDAISSSPVEGLLELAAQKLHGRRPVAGPEPRASWPLQARASSRIEVCVVRRACLFIPWRGWIISADLRGGCKLPASQVADPPAHCGTDMTLLRSFISVVQSIPVCTLSPERSGNSNLGAGAAV